MRLEIAKQFHHRGVPAGGVRAVQARVDRFGEERLHLVGVLLDREALIRRQNAAGKRTVSCESSPS